MITSEQKLWPGKSYQMPKDMFGNNLRLLPTVCYQVAWLDHNHVMLTVIGHGAEFSVKITGRDEKGFIKYDAPTGCHVFHECMILKL